MFQKGLLEDRGGGHTLSSTYVILSDALPTTDSGESNSHKWTLGHVTLHELLYHVHPLGSQEGDPNIMHNYYDGKTGRSHGVGSRQNSSMSNERQKLEEMRAQTGEN